jgi:hypothetical protein
VLLRLSKHSKAALKERENGKRDASTSSATGEDRREKIENGKIEDRKNLASFRK